jgi:hypothetical protein
MEMHLMMMQQKQMGAHVSMSGTEEETRQKQHEEQSLSLFTHHTAELRTLVEKKNDDQSKVDPIYSNMLRYIYYPLSTESTAQKLQLGVLFSNCQ